MSKSTLTIRYKTTVPKEVREKLGVKPSDTLQWEVLGDHARVTAEPIESAQKARKIPPGAGAFDSGHEDTADRADGLLNELGFGKHHP
jgi:bifunctional DNA-binding transcriptional regulator/antitoxin component of YhaV-PrlF toxin-antitoxin module